MRVQIRGWTVAGLLAITVAGLGCHRGYYREQADREAASLIHEKSDDPRWAVPEFSVDVDDRSRYAEVHDLVRPPMPPDDPRSHELMQSVGGMDGYRDWEENGRVTNLENPAWRERLADYAEIDKDGRLHMRLRDAIQLAMIHSPSYQGNVETLYLSALDVSTERFAFQVQFFGDNDTDYTHKGRYNSGGESNTLVNDTGVKLQRKFATAGQLVVDFANTFTWQFAGPDTNAAASLLSFSIVQPLLRSGGRVVGLEQLTRAERALLANLRSFQRYRKGFYTGMAIGSSGGASGPRRSGGFLGGTGLSGFSGSGAGGFGGVGAATGFGGGRFGGGGGGGGAGAGGAVAGVAGGGASGLGGYIGLLQTLQELRNSETNLALQVRTLDLLRASQEAGLVGIDQVLSFEQSIETGRANLLQAQNGYTGSIESFVRGNLGLPPDLEVVLDDTMVRPFQFIDPAVTALDAEVAELVTAFGELETPTVEQLQRTIARAAQLHARVAGRFKVVDGDMKKMNVVAVVRESRMTDRQREVFKGERVTLAEDLKRLRAQHEKSATLIREARAEAKTKLDGEAKKLLLEKVIGINSGVASVVGELSLVQARSRLETIQLARRVKITAEDALAISRANRLDWMNARASLVDSWRLVEYNANALESGVSIVFSGDMKNEGDNPFKLQGPTGSLRAGLQFDAPLTRLRERNSFRQQLIVYQQSRRQMIQFEDGMYQGFRNSLRTLKLREQNLEIQRRQVKIAIRRVDQTRETLTRPPVPGQPAQLGPTATQDLISALSALRDAQNNFMSVWLAYYGGRMSLMRDLGVMRVDGNGLWIDESFEKALEEARQHPSALPPAVPEALLDQPSFLESIGSVDLSPATVGDHASETTSSREVGETREANGFDEQSKELQPAGPARATAAATGVAAKRREPVGDSRFPRKTP
ncbi:MAG: hypothetical protein QF363_21225 [Planctomycetaceae bacterium]|nr:hypothetical protein [Planctomycetaceae bacterium]